MNRLKIPKRKDAVARGAWLEPRPWLRECGAAAGAAAPSGQAADEGGGVGVVQSEAASRPATTVPPQEYMYKNHKVFMSSQSANNITASSGCRATRRSAF